MSAEGDRRVFYRGRKIDVALQAVRLADGSIGDREVVLHRGAVVLLPILDDGRIVLLKNYRYSVGKVLIEAPAGTIDDGEDPDTTAYRELIEETGFTAGATRRVAEWFVSPGIFTERMYLYLCERLTPGPTAHQPDESMENFVVTWDEAQAMIEDGRIEDAKTILALMIGRRHLI